MSLPELTPRLELPSGLAIGYGERLACVEGQDASIVLEGGTHYLLARNGRGKTTLLRTLAGVLSPVDGTYECQGRCQFLSEDLTFDRELPAKTILNAFLSKDKYTEAMKLAETLELDVAKPYGKLSTGNKRKVALLVAEFSVQEQGQNVLLLDEPFTGLDTFSREVFQERWKQCKDGVLRLVSCHPDFDSMEMGSCMLISDGKISYLAGEEAPRKWGELKSQLN
ncbi:MAG: ATP-binding cassette domain-containing protein [Akkermansiaceae bacterium]